VVFLRDEVNIPSEEIDLLRSQSDAMAVRLRNAPTMLREIRAADRYSFDPDGLQEHAEADSPVGLRKQSAPRIGERQDCCRNVAARGRGRVAGAKASRYVYGTRLVLEGGRALPGGMMDGAYRAPYRGIDQRQSFLIRKK